MKKSEILTASLVEDKTRKNFRAIVEHESSNNSFYPSYPNDKVQVKITKATDEDIEKALFELGIEAINPLKIDFIADLLYNEICTLPDGNLCYDEATHTGFFKLVN